MQQHGDATDADDGRGDRRGAPASPPPSEGDSARGRSSRGYFPQGDFPGNEHRRAALITEAAPSLEDQHRARVRRYTILMAIRIPALILAAVAYSIWGSALISLLIIGASIPLPWAAVLIANDRPPRRRDEPSRWDRPQKAIEGRSHNAIDG
ncbi:MAG TPA: DUF3099 domain-containing protein [Nocardia sp.]|uniref:DUF3099 domain-containing protein n=1 Tax=Nocardia sp. TaxID=1821 RepID=UPI002B4B3973|nr:DUF3099 domain-containing protein [Nocardia sp.]HLS78102.1 DUF3099 domain-containing protein [Nocardia sp.]